MKRCDTILIVAGFGLLAFVASRIGWTAVVHQLMTASRAIPVLVAVSFMRLVLQTHAWRIAKLWHRTQPASSGWIWK